MDDQYYQYNIQPEQFVPISKVNQIIQEDVKFVKDQSQQMLALVDIINSFTAENNALKKQISDLENKLKNCDNNQKYINNNCVDHYIYTQQTNQIWNYLNFQNIIYIILLILLILLIYLWSNKKI